MEERLGNIPEKLVDSFSKELTGKEQEELSKWIHTESRNKKLFMELTDVWQATGTVNPSSDYNENDAWEKLRPHLVKTRKRDLSWIRYAAVAVIFTIIGSLAFYLLQPAPTKVKIAESFQEIYVPYGSTSKIMLPDGSYAWLNAGSYLKYSNTFNINNREVFIKGEAFFDVQQNKKLAFVVNAPGIEVKAIGTRFNVKAYPEEKTIFTTVVEGKIQVTNKTTASNKASELFLTANQSASFEKDHVTSPVLEPETTVTQKTTPEFEKINAEFLEIDPQVNTDLYVSWHTGKLIIEREKLGSLAVKLERRYNIKINFVDETVKNYVFSGVLKDETFEQVMEVIRLTSPLQFRIDGNIVKLSEDKSLKHRLN